MPRQSRITRHTRRLRNATAEHEDQAAKPNTLEPDEGLALDVGFGHSAFDISDVTLSGVSGADETLIQDDHVQDLFDAIIAGPQRPLSSKKLPSIPLVGGGVVYYLTPGFITVRHVKHEVRRIQEEFGSIYMDALLVEQKMIVSGSRAINALCGTHPNNTTLAGVESAMVSLARSIT